MDLAVNNSHVLGLTEDGRVVSAGNGENGCCDTGEWENIKDIWVEDLLSFAVDQNGTLHVAGTMQGQEEVLEEVKTWKHGKMYVRWHQRCMRSLVSRKMEQLL